jgi:8-oxo-dGTP pyrophosphatase MutT (NUDIX family)
MPALEQARPFRFLDAAWRTAYRLAFPLARLWWRLRRQRHEGALVAVHVGPELLLVRSSYRIAWNFPGGGIRRGEKPESAARRELAEEIGLAGYAARQPRDHRRSADNPGRNARHGVDRTGRRVSPRGVSTWVPLIEGPGVRL